MMDISTGGFKMITKNQMEQDKDYLLSIILPAGNSARKSVAVKANVCWCSKDIDPELFASGFFFVEIEAIGRLDLATLMFNRAKSKDDAI